MPQCVYSDYKNYGLYLVLKLERCHTTHIAHSQLKIMPEDMRLF
jgi:hypothetical protein